ncbi:MAG: GNAT family N-acetyltransferase [Cyanobacteria bacterium P01_F01_bin.53]
MDLQIRLATKEDLPEILELQAQSLRSLAIGYYKPTQIDCLVQSQGTARSRGFEEKNEVIYLASTNGKLVGLATLLTWSPRIGGLYVHPNFVRQGIALQLLSKIEEAAMIRRYRKLKVMSALSAIKLYEKAGYRRIRSTHFRLGKEVIQCLEMTKTLRNESAQETQQGSFFSSLRQLYFNWREWLSF